MIDLLRVHLLLPTWGGEEASLPRITARWLRSGHVERALRRRDAKIRVARCDVRGKVRGAWCSGTGRIADSQTEQDFAYAALRNKYGWQMRVADFFSTLSGRINQRAVLILTLKG